MESGAIVLDSRRRGSTTRLRFELNSGTNLEELRLAVEANTTMSEAELVFSHSLTERTRQEVTRFIEFISRRPTLRQLTMATEGDLSHYALPISALTTIVDLATGLERLSLVKIELMGQLEDFAALEQSILNHSCLSDISCSSWLSEETRMRLSLDPLIRAFAASRSLQSISFHPAFAFGGLTNVTAGMLCTLPCLHKLNIAKCNLMDENVVAMAETLRDNNILTELRLSCRMEQPGALAIANCLRGNATLETLIIHNTSTPIDSDSTDSSMDIHQASRSTPETNDGHYTEIALALRSNQTLKRFAIHGTKLSQPSQRAFIEMLRHNYTLESISLLDLVGDLKDEMEMYTLLNRCGRARLFQGSGNGRRLWVETMTLVADDINCLFYLLSTKPSLCDLLDSHLDARKRQQGGTSDVHPSTTKRPKTS